MNNRVNSIVNQNEVNTLKEIIFLRAREREKALNESVQDDIMGMARTSFVNNNPFAKILNPPENESKEEVAPIEPKDSKDEDTSNDIGFPLRHLQPQIKRQDRVIIEDMEASTIHSNMIEARAGLSNRKSFMGALNFLNSQAAISLIKTRADRFEVLV